jgi:site-specific recombinase XerD
MTSPGPEGARGFFHFAAAVGMPSSPFVFVSERGTPFAVRGFQAMVERAGMAAGFDMKLHPHMLRHSCGYKLPNEGVHTRTIQAFLGHKSIQHTVKHTELAPTRFEPFSGLSNDCVGEAPARRAVAPTSRAGAPGRCHPQ